MLRSDIKVGMCIISYRNNAEGYVIRANEREDDYAVIWFQKLQSGTESTYISTCQGYTKGIIDLTIGSGLWDFAPVPHFCLMKNLYEVLRKYSDDTFELIGCSQLYEHTQFGRMKRETSATYLKTKRNTILEIVICIPKGKVECEEPILWINECYNVNDLHLMKNMEETNVFECIYYCYDGNPKITFENINPVLRHLYGVTFEDDEDNLFNICTAAKKSDRVDYYNGLEIRDMYLDCNKLHSKEFLDRARASIF